MNNKIKLNLFDLKSKHDLQAVNNRFRENTRRWFKEDRPQDEFFTIRDCPLCDAKQSKQVFEIDGFNYHECKRCESIYARPYPKEEVIDSLYQDGMYQVYQDKLVHKSKALRSEVLDARKFNQIKQLLSIQSPLVLDIGCGSATFLNLCRQNGCIVEGVDPSPIAAEEAFKNYRINVHQGRFDEINLDRRYDLITFWGVLEHLVDPVASIGKATKLLKTGGMLVFEVPSSDCFLRHYLELYPFGPTRYIENARHNIFFSHKIIEKIAKNLHLEVELIETNGLDIQTILFEEFNDSTTSVILNIQDVLNNLGLGDHLRVFLRKTNTG